MVPKLKHKNDKYANIATVDNIRKTTMGLQWIHSLPCPFQETYFLQLHIGLGTPCRKSWICNCTNSTVKNRIDLIFKCTIIVHDGPRENSSVFCQIPCKLIYTCKVLKVQKILTILNIQNSVMLY